jgi:hypothetical protein
MEYIVNALPAIACNMPVPVHASPSAMPQRHTLEALFRRPAAMRLTWSDAVALIEIIGEVEYMANGQCIFSVAGKFHRWRRPHGRDLNGSDVADLSRFLQRAGWSAEGELGHFARKSSAPPLR